MAKKKITSLSEEELALIKNFRKADPFGQEFLIDGARVYAAVNKKIMGRKAIATIAEH